MSYALQSLLRIRVMREDRASGELTAARQAVATASETLATRRRSLADYERTREERRDRLYDGIIGHQVTRDEIDLVQEGIAKIDEEGVLKTEAVNRAEDDLKAREAAEAKARDNFNTATKNRMKIDEHKADWLKHEAEEQEQRAETELEDFTRRPQDD